MSDYNPTEVLLRAYAASTGKGVDDAKFADRMLKDLMPLAKGGGFTKAAQLRGAIYRARQLADEAAEAIGDEAFRRVCAKYSSQVGPDHGAARETFDALAAVAVGMLRDRADERLDDHAIARVIADLDRAHAFDPGVRAVLALAFAELAIRSSDIDWADALLKKLNDSPRNS